MCVCVCVCVSSTRYLANVSHIYPCIYVLSLNLYKSEAMHLLQYMV